MNPLTKSENQETDCRSASHKKSPRRKDDQKYIEDLEKQNQYFREILQEQNERETELLKQIEEMCVQVDILEGVLSSKSWRITRPFRAFSEGMRKMLQDSRWIYFFKKGIKSLRDRGFAVTWNKAKYILHNMVRRPSEAYTATELKRQRAAVFPKKIKFSILVPLYNTPAPFLREMIQSVLDQTYADWELCLADGSDAEHGYVGEICRSYTKRDGRILYQKLEKNMGISGNTNACIDMATGGYLALFDHDDLLHPAALYEMTKVICAQDADFIYTDENTFHKTPKDAFNPYFKPDYAPDTLRAVNYICHFSAFKRELLEAVGKFRTEYDGSQDYDFILRLTEQAKKIVHIPIILYYWRAHPYSVANGIGAKPYAIEAAKRAVSDHLQRVGLKGEVLDSAVTSMYRLQYEIEGEPLVSILIPNCDHKKDLRLCLESIYQKSTYRNFEIIIIENNSKTQEIFAYYQEIQNRWSNIKVVYWNGIFNFSAITNFGAKFAFGEHLLLLNNDTEVISPEWIEEMLMYSQRSDVGAVGAMLYYPDDTIQHAGVIVGLGSVAGHSHKYYVRNEWGYMGRLVYAQNLSAVTAACVMVRRNVWDEIGGMDEDFEVAYNDVDMCMRIRKAGYLIVWTPFAELYHYESKSRGADDTPEKQKRFNGEIRRFQKRWAAELAAGDPYYNPNLTLDKEDFSFR